jgi:hypothetical protein
MIAVFAHTGGLVGAEVGVAGGTAVLAQRVLEAVFGDQAIRRLAEIAKDDLDARVQTLLASELLRYHAILDSQAVQPDQAVKVRHAAAAVQSARSGGLPAMIIDDPAIESAEERKAIGAPTVRQIPAREANSSDDVLEAELVEPSQSDGEWR